MSAVEGGIEGGLITLAYSIATIARYFTFYCLIYILKYHVHTARQPLMRNIY